MKIGIMTINSAYNYGCVLQAWALQKYLEKQGHKAAIINYRIPEIDNVYRLFTERQRYKAVLPNRIYNSLRHLKFNLTQSPRIKKAEKFERFINDVMNTTQVYTSFRELREAQAGREFEVLITGSDQVWNGSITKGLKPAYFLDFDHSGKKKIAYAASIGKLELMKAERDFFQEYLKEYDQIAVREHSAMQLLQPLAKQKLTVVVDPTLLLEKDDFDAIKIPSKYKQPYILVHVIGKDKNLQKIVLRMSELTGWSVVQNRMARKFPKELGRFADAGPEEFLGLVEGAAFVITNSFHATVFSLIYRRNFITIPHKTYPERMANLLQMAGLEEHLISDVEKLPEDVHTFMPDYGIVWKKLKKEQEKSRQFLQRALSEEA